MTALDRIEALAKEAADEAEGDWFDPELIESDLPIYSSRKARRFIAAAGPELMLQMVSALRAAKAHIDATLAYRRTFTELPATAAECQKKLDAATAAETALRAALDEP